MEGLALLTLFVLACVLARAIYEFREDDKACFWLSFAFVFDLCLATARFYFYI